MDSQTFLSQYVDDLTDAAESREFAPFVKKWFASECMLNFHHETQGLDNALRLWTHLIPTGEDVPREVLQYPYKLEDGRVYSHRALQGGNLPKALHGWQETQFDDRTLISDIIITSTQDKPDIPEDPAVKESRLGRIFMEFCDVFNVYFRTGDPDLLAEWCAQDIHVGIDSSFWNMGVIGPHNRIAQSAKFSVQELEKTGEDRFAAKLGVARGHDEEGLAEWEFAVTPDWKVRELVITENV
jgi:hypothetical protein